MKFKKEQVRQAYLKKLMQEHAKYSKPKMADGGAVERLLTPKDQDIFDEYNRMNNPMESQKYLPGNIEALKEIQRSITSPISPITPAVNELPKIDVPEPVISDIKQSETKINETKPEEQSLLKQLVLERLNQKQDPKNEEKYEKLLTEIKEQRDAVKAEQAKAGWATAISNIASGLGKATGVDVGPGMEFQAPQSESDVLDNKLKELKLRQELTPSGSLDDKTLGYLAASERMEMARDKELQDREEFQQRLKLSQDQFEEKLKQSYLPSTKETESLIGFDKSQEILSNIKNNLLPKAEDTIGKYAAKYEKAKNYIPFLESDQDFVALQSATNEQLSAYIKSLSGLTVSDQERKSLEDVMPNVNDKPKTFKTKLLEFEKRLSAAKNLEMAALRKYRGRTIPLSASELSELKKEINGSEQKQQSLQANTISEGQIKHLLNKNKLEDTEENRNKIIEAFKAK